MQKQNIRISIGRNIQKIRLEKNISYDEMSLKTGIKISYLKKIEKGEAKRFTTRHLYLIAYAFGVHLSILFEDI